MNTAPHVFLSIPGISTQPLAIQRFELKQIGFNQYYRGWFTLHAIENASTWLNLPAVLLLRQDHIHIRYHGFIDRILLQDNGILTLYFSAPILLLHRTQHCRNFHGWQLSAIIRQLWIEAGFTDTLDFEMHLHEDVHVPLLMQYNQTNFDFFIRICQDFGLTTAMHQTSAYACCLISDDREFLNQRLMQLMGNPKPEPLQIHVTHHQQTHTLERIEWQTGHLHWQIGMAIHYQTQLFRIEQLSLALTSVFSITVSAQPSNIKLQRLPKHFHKMAPLFGVIYARSAETPNLTEQGFYRVHFEMDLIHGQQDNHLSLPIPLCVPVHHSHNRYHQPLHDGDCVLLVPMNHHNQEWVILGAVAHSRAPNLINSRNYPAFGWQSYAGNLLRWSARSNNTFDCTFKDALPRISMCSSQNHSESLWHGQIKLNAKQAIYWGSHDVVMHAFQNASFESHEALLQTHNTEIETKSISWNNQTSTLKVDDQFNINAKHLILTGDSITQKQASWTVTTSGKTNLQSGKLQLTSRCGSIFIGNNMCYLHIKPTGIEWHAKHIRIQARSFIATPPTLGIAKSALHFAHMKPHLKMEPHTAKSWQTPTRITPAPLNAQIINKSSLARIQVIVVFDQNNPLANGDASLVSDNTVLQTHKTNQAGQFTIEEPPASPFKIKIKGHEVWQSNDAIQAPFHSIQFDKIQWRLQAPILRLHVLAPPIILNFRDASAPHLLTQKQIQYFKQHNNTIVLFIHGYNLAHGHFGKHLAERNSIDPLLFSNEDATIFRKTVGLNDSNCNGVGAHNWFVHMEWNVNRASGRFDGQNYSEFRRLAHISWPGDPHSPMDYMQAVSNAKHHAVLLADLLKQCIQSGLKIQIICHSLANALILHALNHLGMQKQYNAIDLVVMWQAAVPDSVFSGQHQASDIYRFWDLPHAVNPVKQFLILYSANDNILGPSPKKPFTPIHQQKKELSEELLTDACMALHLHSIYAVAMTLGVPITTLRHDSVRNQFYQDWINIYPRNRKNKPFQPTLIQQYWEYVGDGTVSNWSVTADTFLAHLFKPYKSNHSNQHNWLDIDFYLSRLIPQERLHLVNSFLTLAHVIFDTDIPIPRAMGSVGPDLTDSTTQNLIARNKITTFDQGDLLSSHGAMKYPHADLFSEVYCHLLAEHFGLGR